MPAVKGIETHVHDLTDETVPLYTDVLRLRYTVQDMASDFFELGKAEDLAQLEQVSNKIVANIQTAESISDDLRRHGQLQAPRYHAAFEREFQRMRVAVRTAPHSSLSRITMSTGSSSASAI